MFAAAITNPVNVVKVRMQLDGALGTQVSAFASCVSAAFELRLETRLQCPDSRFLFRDRVHHSFPPYCPTQPRAYLGLGRGLSKIWTEEGLKGLWRGTNAALLREASYSSIRMGAYEPFKQVTGNDCIPRTWEGLRRIWCSPQSGNAGAGLTEGR